MNKISAIKFLLLILPFILLIVVKRAESYPVLDKFDSVNEMDDGQFIEYLNQKGYPELVDLFLNNLSDMYNMQNDNKDKNDTHPVKVFSRERRRLSVFKNIYQQCRIQKRKGKDLCLYLANLYQNVKGFHGL